jgi:two-component system, cell cycle sensor histidine kinase and response regulator CckA
VKPATVLLVEDNPITRKMMRFALEAERFCVVEAGDGRTALKLAGGQAPALIVHDYVLPDMDGRQLMEGLRRLPGLADTPVLVVTGMVSQIEELRRQALPNTTFLPKPIEPSVLIEAVRSHLAGGRPDVGSNRRVLVVDDESLNRKLAGLRLRDVGFDVEAVSSGEEALASARRVPPDAILSDVLMPGMDGFLLCRAVRADPRLAHIPVVLLSSAYVDEADQTLAREVGANALLPRTSDMQPAVAALGEALRSGGRAPSRPAGAEVDSLHKERVQIQLERQVARNDALLRQGAIQAAALSVVRGLAEALAKPHDLASVLGDVLVHCLDATGLSTGLLYLVSEDRGLQLRAQAGVPPEARAEAAACFGHPEVLRRILERGDPIGIGVGSSAPPVEPTLIEVAQKLGRGSTLFIPFVFAEQRVGILLLAADSQDFSEGAWLGFARTLAVQFGQTVAVGQSLFRGAASEARYRTLMEQANDAILLLDQGLIVEANQQAEALLDRPRTAMVGRPYEEFVVSDTRTPPIVFGEGTTRVQDQLLRRSDGSAVSVDVSASPVRIGEETIVLLILRDITERKRAEVRLQESEEQYRRLFDSNPHPMAVYDPETLVFLAVNDAAVRLYGYTHEQFLEMSVRNIVTGEEAPARADGAPAAEPDKRGSRTWKHRLKDGSIADVEVATNSIVFRGRKARLALATDVSEKRRLESQLLQAQKMEAVGRLAGGVAHDFNNILSVITGYSELLRRKLEPQHPGQRRVEEIQKAANRAAALTRQLLTFSRKQVLETEVLGVNEIASDLEMMLERLIGEDVHLSTRLDPQLGRVRGARGQIEQVILNLVVNARDAMPRGGDLIIETSNTLVDEAYARSHPDARPGRYAVLSVSDNGDGMDAETQSHIFEPFFTTKEEGKGTGLGLSTVFGIVKQSGGFVNVYSEVGVGSTFKVYLPRVDEEISTTEDAPGPESLPRGDETILLVEDAEALRVMIREILEAAGYSIIDCGDPGDALQKAATAGTVIDLVVTDVIMPRMSGPELVRSLLANQPTLKVLYMSGYTDAAISQHDVLEAGAQFIQKPFSTGSLLRKVRGALGRPA